MVKTLDCVEVSVGTGTDWSIIWLHGLGADGHDFEPIVPELGLPAGVGVRFVFPHAPMRPVTINGGMVMRAWYDIYGFDSSGPVDKAGMQESGSQVEALIQRELERGTANERILVAGFSQGGAIALQYAVTTPRKLAGIVGLSTYLPLARELDSQAANKTTPFFMAHGTLDPILPVGLGQAARGWLDERGYSVEWHEYPMAHQVCAEEIAHLSKWLSTIMSA